MVFEMGPMKRKIKAKGAVGRRGVFGGKGTVAEVRGGEVSGRNRRELVRERRRRPYSIEEMMFYDDLFDGDR